MLIYMDVDGVVADFLAGVRHFVPSVYQSPPAHWDGFLEGSNLSVEQFFETVYNRIDFYEHVGLLPRAIELGSLADYFVTSCRGLPLATASKLKWLDTFFPGKPVVIVDNKKLLDYRNAVLVDDRPDSAPHQLLYPTPVNESHYTVDDIVKIVRLLKHS